MLSANQVPSKIKQITNSGMRTKKSSSLFHRYEPPHTSFSHPSRLMRLFGPIILTLLRTVDRLRYQLTMCDCITTQFVGNDLPRLAAMASQ